MSYQQDTPVAPRFDVNAPDLYIPAMGFITYVLVAGLALGTQNRYTFTFLLLITRDYCRVRRNIIHFVPSGFLQSCWEFRPVQRWCG